MPNDKSVKSFRPDLPEELDPADDDQLPSGRIIHDERGNAVWKWYGEDTSSTGMGTGTGVLEHLDANDLKVENLNPSEAFELGGGYDPYNQVQPRKKR